MSCDHLKFIDLTLTGIFDAAEYCKPPKSPLKGGLCQPRRAWRILFYVPKAVLERRKSALSFSTTSLTLRILSARYAFPPAKA